LPFLPKKTTFFEKNAAFYRTKRRKEPIEQIFAFLKNFLERQKKLKFSGKFLFLPALKPENLCYFNIKRLVILKTSEKQKAAYLQTAPRE